MDNYIFYLCKGLVTSVSLEVHALASDRVAADWASKILAQHPAADCVSVVRRGVAVLTVRRGDSLATHPLPGVRSSPKQQPNHQPRC